MLSGRFTRMAKVGGDTATCCADCTRRGMPRADIGRRSTAWRSVASTSPGCSRFCASAATTST